MTQLKVGSTQAARRAGPSGPDQAPGPLRAELIPRSEPTPAPTPSATPPPQVLAPGSQLPSDQARGQPGSPSLYRARFVNGFGSGSRFLDCSPARPARQCSGPLWAGPWVAQARPIIILTFSPPQNTISITLQACLQPFVLVNSSSHRSKKIPEVQSAFQASEVKLTPIWNYNPDVFFKIPHFTSQISPNSPFLLRNEHPNNNSKDLWYHNNNAWLRHYFDEESVSSKTEPPKDDRLQGSILADDMGLGKTLTTLAFILATCEEGRRFQKADPKNQSSATLVIFPLATLSNWQNKISLHFNNHAITYKVFHGDNRKKMTKEDLQSSMMILTTYKMITTSGNKRHHHQLTIESLDLFWFIVVLDKAQNPITNRTQSIQNLHTQFVLCLTGTPVQNRLTNLQILITLLNIHPWNEEWVWKCCLIPQMNVGARQAIKTVNRLMQAICLRRTKEVLLQLPEKVEKIIVVNISPQWEEVSQMLHTTFIDLFERLQTAGERWDSSDFFRQLTMLRQFCNHPLFARSEIEFQPEWQWQDLAKVVHQGDNLKVFLEGVRGINRTKAVVFSSFTGFLGIIERALEENNIKSTWLTGDNTPKKRDEKLEEFQTNNTCNVLLASVQAGGVGIDLRCAQNVYMMEPGWNPAAEIQAVDRLYRLGQVNPVHVYQYYVRGSLKMNIYQVQKRKGKLAMLSIPSGGNENYECAQLLMKDLIG
ncbi:uncharacterized protein PGTG_21841 [Puccinia graminis f. sp. tritici CRL 75-36-700-3]|uniref:Uncharacterized protein n=1 Tax=Puccinia graminis f. sp. tritici (strain CRL 75-36-700-3 / race SCCL) TaxID=418459 RepID=H6QSJ8_PUCGT|nr:uncharacterized protein PGTG_21841 [Puccinia graminis f. sp. tritici CRL 75-36-700-3]EHS63749.1 hypothetical protein PGTG_21841 [Puccinia graminis f. sp. tritici CRL 75-36-700-3]